MRSCQIPRLLPSTQGDASVSRMPGPRQVRQDVGPKELLALLQALPVEFPLEWGCGEGKVCLFIERSSMLSAGQEQSQRNPRI